MRNFYIIGGAMGVGKTTVCRRLQQTLPNCAFLDGDWCWDMHPFTVTEETKAMALDNICHVLNNFLRCTAFENVVFCWVLHQQAIWDAILARLDTGGWRVIPAALVCSEAALTARLQQDVDAGVRRADVIPRSLARLPLYAALNTAKLDVSDLTPAQAAARLAELGGSLPQGPSTAPTQYDFEGAPHAESYLL